MVSYIIDRLNSHLITPFCLIDVAANRKLLIRILERKGLSCDQAIDGSEAIEIVTEKGINYYDIIFMDSIMPNLCGPDATESLRAMGCSNLIIGVTGNALDTDIAVFEQAGVDLVIPKPVRVDILDKVLDYCRLNHSLQRMTLKQYLVSTGC